MTDFFPEVKEGNTKHIEVAMERYRKKVAFYNSDVLSFNILLISLIKQTRI